MHLPALSAFTLTTHIGRRISSNTCAGPWECTANPSIEKLFGPTRSFQRNITNPKAGAARVPTAPQTPRPEAAHDCRKPFRLSHAAYQSRRPMGFGIPHQLPGLEVHLRNVASASRAKVFAPRLCQTGSGGNSN